MARLCIVLLLLFSAATWLHAEEDPAVTEAREIARQKFELERARRQADEARKKLADEQRAIALTRQGLVTLYNPENSHVIFNCRWLMWNGSYSSWIQQETREKRTMAFHILGGIKFEINFTSPGNGKKEYLVSSEQAPNDVKPTADDGRPFHFKWGGNQDLDLITGKP